MTSPTGLWNDDRVTELKRLWIAGASAAEFAKALDCGLSRNAVIGKVHRLGLDVRMTPRQISRPAAPRKAPAPTKPPAARKAPAPPLPVVPPPSSPAPAPRQPVGILALDAAFRICRWIVGRDPRRRGRDLYCAAPTVRGGSWCCEHHRVANVKPEVSARRRAQSQLGAAE